MIQNLTFAKNNKVLTIWAVILLSLGVFSYLYYASIETLFGIWNEYGTYSHGYLTVLLSVYLTFVSVKENRINYSKPSIISALGLVLTSMVWLVSDLSGINIGQTLCLPFFVFFTTTYFLGLRSYRALLIPVFILLLVVPVWSVLLPYLQGIATYLVNNVLSFSSLEYQSIGKKIILQAGVFEIEESCSGLRFILVGVLLSVVFGFLNYKSYWATLLLVLSSIVIMLVANVVRILVIIAIGAKTDMAHPLVQDHASLGWVIFAIFLVPLFVLARYLDPNLFFKGKDDNCIDGRGEFSMFSVFISLVLYLSIIFVAPFYAQYAKNNIDQVAKIDNRLDVVKGWDKLDLNESKWELNYILYSGRFKAEYIKNENEVALSIYLYTKEIAGSELINFNNTLVDESKWSVVKSVGNQPVSPVSGSTPLLYVNKATIESDVLGECKRIWYWFDIDGKTYTKGWRVKLGEALMLVKGKSGSVINTISTSCGEASDRILAGFLADNFYNVKKITIW